MMYHIDVTVCNNNLTVIILAQTYVFGVGCCHYLCTMIVLEKSSQVVVFIEVSPRKLEPKPMIVGSHSLYSVCSHKVINKTDFFVFTLSQEVDN